MILRPTSFLLYLLALPTVCGLSGCASLQSISINPAAGFVVLNKVGQTAQFTALGGSSMGSASPTTTSITNSATWTAGNPGVATISASGLATAVGNGQTQIMAESDGKTATSDVTVNIITGTSGTDGASLLSLNVIPSSITVGNLQDTGQFLAFGTFSTAPYVRDLTNSPLLTWISAVPSVFPVNTNNAGTLGATAGIVTAYGAGSAIIIAEAKNIDGTIQTATATFVCTVPTNPVQPGQCYPGSQTPALLATLTVYNEGLNTAGWLVTAPSATGTPAVLHCGPGSTSGSVCVATYPIGVSIVLTAPGEPGVAFGGWSYNCAPVLPVNADGPNSCSVILTTNDTVGAIFN